MATCNICKYAGTPIYKSPCSECKGFSKYEYEKPQTSADIIQAMDDVELMNRIYELHVLLSECGHYELTRQFCDGKAECADDEDCSEDRVKACILRWIKQPAEG